MSGEPAATVRTMREMREMLFLQRDVRVAYVLWKGRRDHVD